ncbi:MAG TPA: DUF1573 domain-containing protein [Luteolibacter sp.]
MKFAIGIWLTLAAFATAAGLEFTEMLKEVNAAVDVSSVTTEFNFTNKGKKPVTITSAKPSCDCLKVQISGGKLKYASGESGVIRITFDLGNSSGTVDKTMPIYLDADPEDKPSVVLTLRAHIPVLIDVEPKTVKWELGGGKLEPKTIQIRMAGDKPIRVTGIKPTSDAFAYELKMLEEGKKYDVIVTPLNLQVPGISIIRIETDCEVSKYRIQQAFATIYKPAASQPAAKP